MNLLTLLSFEYEFITFSEMWKKRSESIRQDLRINEHTSFHAVNFFDVDAKPKDDIAKGLDP